jgi:hypothetical protein
LTGHFLSQLPTQCAYVLGSRLTNIKTFSVNRQTASHPVQNYESCKAAFGRRPMRNRHKSQVCRSLRHVIAVTTLDVGQQVILDVTVLAKSPRRGQEDPGCQSFDRQLNRTPKRRQRFGQQSVITVRHLAVSRLQSLPPSTLLPTFFHSASSAVPFIVVVVVVYRFICWPRKSRSISF